jgi:hypothetical protein
MNESDHQRHAAVHRKGLVSRAEKGDVPAAVALLQHAMACMRKQKDDFGQADAIAMEWLANGIGQFLSGVPIERALGIEQSGGRPQKASGMHRAIEDARLWDQVENAKKKQVAVDNSVSVSTVSAALTRHAKIRFKLAEQNVN